MVTQQRLQSLCWMSTRWLEISRAVHCKQTTMTSALLSCPRILQHVGKQPPTIDPEPQSLHPYSHLIHIQGHRVCWCLSPALIKQSQRKHPRDVTSKHPIQTRDLFAKLPSCPLTIHTITIGDWLIFSLLWIQPVMKELQGRSWNWHRR